MLTRVLLCAAALIGVSSLGAGKPETRKILRQDSSWRKYTNKEWAYCLDYPGRWVRGDAFDGAGLYFETGLKKLSRPLGEIDVTAISGNSEPPAATPVSLTEHLQSHFEGLRRYQRAQQIDVFEQRETTILGRPALFTKDRYFDPQDRGYWLDEIVFVKNRERIFRLELECPAGLLERFEPVFAHVLSSFKFDCSQS